MHIINFYLNGESVRAMVKTNETLLTTLRDRMDLNSPKCGCNRGDCGSCTVIMDGKAVKSCTILSVTIEGKRIVTTEGVGTSTDLHPLQQAMLAYGAPQCGYCTPGILMAAIAHLLENEAPTDEEIKDALAGNLCRCGGYKEYIQAIQAAIQGEFGELPKGGEMNV